MSGLILPVPARFVPTQGFQGHNPNEPSGFLAPDGLRAKLGRTVGWTGYAHLHKAQDRACPIGTPLVAPQRGIVVQQGVNARFSDGSIDGELFQFLQIHRDATSQTLVFFTHLSKFVAVVGAHVAQGQRIALTGNSGRSTGPHVHWEVITGSRSLTPWGVWSQGIHWDPQQCVTGGSLAGRSFLVPNV